MLNVIIGAALARRPLVLLSLAAFLGAGLVAFQRLNIEAYPNSAPVILEITAQVAGLSAEEMERYYTIPMEVGLAATPGVEIIRSTSFYGLSFVRLTFRYGVDYWFAYTQAALSLQQNVSLPGGVQPQIQQSSEVGEILRYQVVGPPHFGLSNLRTVQDWVVARRLLQVAGITQINSWGGTTKEYDIVADQQKLEAYSITLPQLLSALGNSNVNVGGRDITMGQQFVNIRGVGRFDSGGAEDVTKGIRVQDIETVVLSQSNGIPILVRDVAKVEIGHRPRLGILGRDHDDDAVAAIVVMGRTYHTNDVLPRVKAEIDRINADGSLPPGVKIVPFYDRGALVETTTHTVLHNLIFGCILVFLIQLVFLGDLRSAVIVGVNIPVALFFAVILLVLSGESANLLSVGAVDFGIIVDSAVILVENVFRNLQHRTKSGELEERQAVIRASALEVDKAVLFSTLITVAAFIPLFTMEGVEGQIFGPMARTYGYALAGALIATFTVSPVLAVLLLPEKVKEVETVVVRRLRDLYTPVLGWTLANRGRTMALGLGVLCLAALVASRLGSEFLPALEEGNFWIRASMPTTLSLSAGTEPSHKMREILLRHPEVITVVSQHGRPDDGSDASPFSNVELFAPLRPLEAWPAGMTKERLTEELQKEFNDELPGVTFNFSQYIQDNIEEDLSGVKGANSVKIIGPKLETLEHLATQVLHEMEQVKGVADLGVFRVLGQPNLNIRIDRARAARYGLNTGDVNTAIQAGMGGVAATQLFEADRQFDVVVRLTGEQRDTVEKVGDIKVGYATGNGGNAYVPLRELADISVDTGASWIYHERSARYIPVKFSVRGRDLGSTVSEAQERIARNVTLPPGYRIIWAGEFGELQDAIRRLEIIVPISLLLILGLLYSLFNSLRDSLLVLAGIPFAVAGGILALAVTGLDFSVSAAIGFVSLFGVSVMDGILMLSYFNELAPGASSPAEAMAQAAEQRMRPMMMTALSACIGLLPAAFSQGIGSQVQRPLATVIVGGMLIGPALLLTVVPALRLLVIDKVARFRSPKPPPSVRPEAAP